MYSLLNFTAFFFVQFYDKLESVFSSKNCRAYINNYVYFRTEKLIQVSIYLSYLLSNILQFTISLLHD